MNQQRLLFKHFIFLFDRKNTNSPTSRRCDRELRSNNCDFIKEFVDFVHAEDLQCKKTKHKKPQYTKRYRWFWST